MKDLTFTFAEVQEFIEEQMAGVEEAQDQAQEKRDGAELLRLQGQIRALRNLDREFTRSMQGRLRSN